MKTITDSLKNFYAKLGGNPSNLPSRSTSADIIDAMSDVYTDKEGTHVEVTTQVTEGTKIATVKTNNEDHDIYAPKELPSVTSSDEGKVLTVDSNGDWGAATPGGGSGSSIINCTVTQDPDVATQFYMHLPSGVTSQDIGSRLASGEYIILCAETKLYYPLNSTGDMFATMVGYDGETVYASAEDDYYELTSMLVDISYPA